MEIFLRDPNYEFSVHYLNGNAINSKDLARAVTERAKVCILMTNMKSRDPVGMDHKNILTGLALKKYVLDMTNKKVNLRLCMQLLKAESKLHYQSSIMTSKRHLSDQDQIIIVEEMKMNLIAKSCFSPGLITLVSNLITSSTDLNEETDERWVEEYSEGMGHEIYRIKLSDKMERKYFIDIVRIIYKKTNAIVFAIEVKCNNKSVIRLNPSDFMVNNIQDNDIHVYAICPDKQTAESIETIEMNKDEKSRYFILKELKNKEDKIILAEQDENEWSESSDDDGPTTTHTAQARMGGGTSLFNNQNDNGGDNDHDQEEDDDEDEENDGENEKNE